MFDILPETPLDMSAREALLDRCFGPSRRAKTAERLREGREPAAGLALAARREGGLAGTIRLWNIEAGSAGPALLLGPVAVDPDLQGAGLGASLVREALARAATAGHRAVLLVGDMPYYARFGFSRELVLGLSLPGPHAPERFLGLELVIGALTAASGLVRPTGRAVADPDSDPLRCGPPVMTAAAA